MVNPTGVADQLSFSGGVATNLSKLADIEYRRPLAGNMHRVASIAAYRVSLSVGADVRM